MKAKIRKTGEIIEVVAFNGTTIRTPADRVSFIDSEGNEQVKNINFYWDLEHDQSPGVVDESGTSLRSCAAVAVMQALLSCRETYSALLKSAEKIGAHSEECLAEIAVTYADALVKRLGEKKESDK